MYPDVELQYFAHFVLPKISLVWSHRLVNSFSYRNSRLCWNTVLLHLCLEHHCQIWSLPKYLIIVGLTKVSLISLGLTLIVMLIILVVTGPLLMSHLTSRSFFFYISTPFRHFPSSILIVHADINILLLTKF